MKKFNVGQCYYWRDGMSSYNNDEDSCFTESYLRISDVDAWTPDGPGISIVKINFINNDGVISYDISTSTLEVSVFASMLNRVGVKSLDEIEFKNVFQESLNSIYSAAC